MIFLVNNGTESTIKILKLIKNENLPIFIFEDGNREFDQTEKFNELLLMAINEFKADIIIPLDVDEFIISSDKGNPRDMLEKLESSTFNLIKWKTYVPNFGKNENNKFIPSRITMARDESLEEYYKVILQKELVNNYDVKLTNGNHDLVYDQKYEKLVKRTINMDLYMAHFPIRSKEQIIFEIMNNCVYLCQFGTENIYWRAIFNDLKKSQRIRNEDITRFAKEFALKDKITIINIKEDPIDTSFCKDIEIKYTNENSDFTANILEIFERLSLAYLNLKNEKANEEERLKSKIVDLSMEIYEFYNEKTNEKNRLDELISSNSWKLTEPLRKFGKWIRSSKF